MGLGIELYSLPRVDKLVARDVGFPEGLHYCFRICGLGPVYGVGQDEGRPETAGGVFTHVHLVVLLIELGHLPDQRFFLGQVQCEGRAHEHKVAVGLDRGQVAGLDVTGHVEKAFGHHVHFLEGLGKEDGIGDVGGVHNHVRLGRHELAHLAGHVARVRRVSNIGHDLVAEFLGILFFLLAHIGPELGVFVKQADGLDLLAGLFLQVFEELELVFGHGPVMGRHAEKVFEAAVGQSGRGRSPNIRRGFSTVQRPDWRFWSLRSRRCRSTPHTSPG